MRVPDEEMVRPANPRLAPFKAAQGALKVAETVKPDEAGLALRESERLGIPAAQAAQAVAGNPEAARLADTGRDKVLRANPRLARWLSKPDHAAIGQDDVPALGRIEEAARGVSLLGALPDAASAGAADLAARLYHLGVVRGYVTPEVGAAAVARFKRAAAAARASKPAEAVAFEADVAAAGPRGTRLVEEAGGLAGRAYRGAIEGAADFVAQTIGLDGAQRDEPADVPDVAVYLDRLGSGFGARDASGALARAAGEALDVGAAAARNPEGLAYATAENLPNAVPSVVGGLAGGLAAGPVGTGAGAFGGSYLAEFGGWVDQRLGDRGVDQTDEAALLAAYRDAGFMAGASAEANRKAMATAGVDALFGFLAGRKVVGAAKGGAGAAVAAGARETGEQMAGEALGEAAGQLAATGRLDVADVILEGLVAGPQSAVEVAGGAATRALGEARAARRMADPKVAAEALGDAVKAIQAQQDAAAAVQAGEAFGGSAAAKRLPAAVRVLADEAAAAGGIVAPSVAVEAWDAAWTAAGKSPAAEAQRVTGSATAYAEAKATGALAIPYSRVAEAGADAEFAAVLPHVRFRPDHPTAAEAEAVLADLPARMEAAAVEAEARAPDVTEEDVAADEARAAELEAAVGLPDGASLLFQEAAPAGEPKPEIKPESGTGTAPVQPGAPLRAAADAIEAATPGLLGGLVNAVTGATPVADAVRATLSGVPEGVTEPAPEGTGSASGGAALRRDQAGAAASESLAAAAQADPKGTAAAIRELADIRDRQATQQGPAVAQRRTFEAAIRAAGRPAKEAQQVAAVLTAFVRTMQARFPQIPPATWDALMVRFARTAAPEGALEQTAYHGSPHSFDKFSLHKIGTGEGAQAYGWGLYFAGNREVAELYRRVLTGRKVTFKALTADENALVNVDGLGDDIAQGGFAELERTIATFSKMVDRPPKYHDAAIIAENTETLRALIKLRNAAGADGDLGATTAGGKLYTVDLAPAEDEYLLWDRPLAEQSEKVKAALAGVGPQNAKMVEAYTGDALAAFAEQYAQAVEDGETGESFYRALTEDQVPDVEGAPNQAARDVSELLASAGIPGIKYLDGSSRGKGEGSFNYVIFDDNLVKITALEQRPEGGAARGAYSRLTRTIHLFQTADWSTAAHESSHWMVDVLGTLAADPAAPDALRAMYADLTAAAGAEPGAALTTAQHETIAREFEAYLRTGEAPSAGLRRAFAVMAAALRKVYRTIRELIGADAVNPELRAVFDRMLATDEELAAAEAQAGLAPMFPTAAELAAAGVDPETAAKYQQQVAAARDDAIAKITRRVMASIAAEQKAEREAVLATYRAEIAARVDELPAMVALANMKDGDAPEGTATVKLDYDATADALGDETAGRLRKLGVTVEAGGEVDAGLSPQAAAELFGFDSADALADGLLLARNADRLVDTIARARLKAERPDLLMDRDAIREQARRNVVSASREEVLSAELRILMDAQRAADRAAAPTRAAETREAAADAARAVEADIRRAAFSAFPMLAETRDIARRTLAGKTLRNIRPSVYLAAVQREGRAAAAAVRSGAFQVAAKHKNAQAMNLALYREATKLTDAAERDRRFLRRMAADNAQSVLGRAGFTYKDQVNAILARHDLGRISDADAARRAALADWIKDVEAETGRQPDIPPSVLRDAARTNWRDLTADALNDARTAVQSIYEIARTKDKLLKAKAAREVAQASADILASASATLPALPPEPRLSRSDADRDADKWAAARGALAKVPQIARELDGDKDGGPAWEYLVRPINEAADARRTREHDVANQRARLNALFTKAEIRDMHVKRPVPGVAESVSHADRLMVLLNMGNEGNLSRLIGRLDERTGRRVGGTIAESEAAAIVAQATTRDLEWVRGIWAIYEALRPDVFTMHERLTGVRPQAVEARPFTVRTADGQTVQMPGGYFPIRYAGIKGEDVEAESAAREIGKAITGRAMTAHGHTQARQQFVANPLRLELGVIDQTLSQIILDLTHREALIDAQRVLRHDDTKAAIIGHLGRAKYEQFRALYADISADDQRFAERSDWVVNRIRRGTSSAILGVKLTTALINLSGVTQSVQRVGPRWYFEGLRHALGDPRGSAGVVEWIHSISPFMRGRGDNITRETAEAAKQLTGNKGSGLDAFNYWLYGRTQVMVDVPTWLGAYHKALAADPTDEARAVALADQAVRDAQGSGDLVDLAAIQRGSAWRKLSTVFYHYASTQLARQSGAWRLLRVRDPATYGKFLADQALLFFLPIALGVAFKAAVSAARGEEPDDEESIVAALGKEGAGYVLGLAPLLRELGGIAHDRFRYEGRASDRVFSALGQVAQQTFNALDPEAEADVVRGLEGANMTAGIWFGYPADQINKTAAGFRAWLDGDAGPQAILLGPPRRGR